MAENTTDHGDARPNDPGSVGSDTEKQDQEEQRVQTGERLSMNPSDMADAINHEEDQKFDSGRGTRYEDEVEEALPDDAR